MNDEIEPTNPEPANDDGPRPGRINPRVMAGVIIGGVVLLAFAIWFFAIREGGDAGRPVPAPRGSFEDQPSEQQLTGVTVTLTPEQAEASGIMLETVGEQLAADSGQAAATGVVEADAYRETPAVSLVSGVVRRVIPELGQNVSRGQTVAVVSSNEFAETQSRYVSLLTERENARRNYERTQRLVTINQPGRTEADAAQRQVKAAEAALVEAQKRYDRTAKLVQIGASSREEFEQDTTKLRTADAELSEARNRLARAQRLLDISPEVRAANEEALNRLRTAESEAAAYRERLIVYGMSPAAVNALRTPSQVTADLNVPAPISGTVTARSVNGGEVIEANKELLRVTDLSSVWVIAQVYEQDLGRLRVGSGASVTTEAYPDRLFRGQVTYIDPQLDEATRTGKVRVELDNGGGLLKLGMYVRVAFGALQMAERTVPVIPASALQTVGGRTVVFVPTSDPNAYEMRPVRVGPESNGQYQVFEGINVGDRVVTQGSFMLRAEVLKLNPGIQP